MKKTFFTEIAFICGIIFMSFGIALQAKADIGMSMVVAPAFVIYSKISQYWSWFTLGMAQYTFQFVLILILCLVIRRFNIKFFLSFVTAFIDGLALDLAMWIVAFIPEFGLAGQIIFYLLGMVITSIGVAFFFKTYIAPEAYELFVKEFSRSYKKDIHKVKTIYDISSLMVAVILSFALFGWLNFVGVKWGTLICALVNGFIIGFVSKTLDKWFDFKDAFKFRKFFEI